jgi:serine protease
VIEQLRNQPGVEFAEREAVRYAWYSPNDYLWTYQWHMRRINADDAWDYTTGSGVVVAVIDTGVLQSLQDLNNTNFVAGYDFVNSDSNPTDDNGHGSHVAGTVAQSTNNSIGVAGVAYGASIMPIKVLDAGGSGWDTDIADGIYWAVNHGADILNLSLGGYGTSTALQNAVNYAWNQGCVIVCAAGNDNTTLVSYPAGYANSMSVSATEWRDYRAYYSNYGSTIDICAPGGDITIDRSGDGYVDGVLQNTRDFEYGLPEGYYYWQGTSMACPHVAGVAALVKSRNMALTNSQIRNILQTTARDLGPAGWDNQFGHGQVDALAAVRAVGPIYGYVVAGSSQSYTNGNWDFLVYKVDDKGTKQWRKNYGGLSSDQCRSIRQTSDGGFLVAGYSYSYSNGESDFLVYKVDSKGAKQWRKNYGGSGFEFLSTAIQTADGGYLIFGDTYSYTHGSVDSDFLIYKVDASGAKQWRKNYGGSGNENVNNTYPVGDGLVRTSDGGYAFIGDTTSYTHGYYDFLVYKVDASGAKLWRRNLGGDGYEYGFGIDTTSDGGYVVAGYTDTYTNGGWDFLVYKLNAAGVKEWRKNFGGALTDRAYSVHQTSDGGYIVGGRTTSYGDAEEFLAYRLDASGNKLWRKNYGGSAGDRGGQIVQTADGGFIIAGYTYSYTHGSGDTDFLVYKVDAAGAKQWRKNYGGSVDDEGLCVQQTID